jgi:hypothetical protein
MANSANSLNIKSPGIPVFDGVATFTESTTTQFNVLVGDTANAIANVAPSATSGVPLISQGNAANPTFGTAVVAGGGSGAVSFTAHGVLLGEGTSPFGVTAVGTTGQVLTGVTGADPVWASPAASSITITGDSGGALGPSSSFTFTGGSTGLTFAGSGSTETLGGTLAIANGGTNATSMATTDGVVYYDGTRLVTTAVGTATQVLTSNGAGVAPTFQAVGGGFTWSEITGATVALAVANGYIMNRGTLITATLPATAALGSIIALVGKGAGGWLIAQNSGQTIHFGNLDTTTGATGSLASTAQYDCVEIICTTANTDFVVRSSIGNLTVA